MAEEKELLDLKVEHNLLDANFDGYKLSLEPVPLKELHFKDLSPYIPVPSSAQFSIQHLKLFSMYNSMFFDETTSKNGIYNFYVITSHGNIQGISYNCHTLAWHLLPTPSATVDLLSSPSEFALPPSIIFVTETLVTVSDGMRSLIVYGREQGKGEWKNLHTVNTSITDNSGFMLVDAKLANDHLHLLLQSVKEKTKEEKEEGSGKERESPFYNAIYWIMLEVNPDGNITTSRTRTISQKGHVEMCTLDSKCENLISFGSKHPEIIADSAGLKKHKETKDVAMKDAENGEGEATNPIYFWRIQDDEITVTFALGEHVRKEDVKFQINPTSVYLAIGDVILLGGKLGGSVKPQEAVWTVSDQKMTLELTLFKTSADERWKELVVGDRRGRFEPDAEIVAQAAHLLERFTSDKKAMGTSGANENFNADQLEECDMQIDDELAALYWLHGEKQTLVKQADITGHQLLFVDRRIGEPARICLRHDVDGILWNLIDGKPVHSRTFNAFGYVQAGKQFRKFTSASPSGSYAVIAEDNNHAFVYWQSTAVTTDLRNRKTNTAVKEIAKQLVISLKKQEDAFDMGDQKRDTSIQGIYAADETLFILTKDTVYAAKLA